MIPLLLFRLSRGPSGVVLDLCDATAESLMPRREVESRMPRRTVERYCPDED